MLGDLCIQLFTNLSLNKEECFVLDIDDLWTLTFTNT